MKGDEIMVINGAIVSDLDMMFIESVLQEELTLCMMLRSSRPGKLYGTLHATFTQPLCLIDVVMVVELEIQANNFLLNSLTRFDFLIRYPFDSLNKIIASQLYEDKFKHDLRF